ncbi:MAG: rRNA maturation RNase YbeY [Parcubacteria group bacterium]|nr:rRNA maturation RNase YbeY [Parcubacteria group bacterium]
MSTVSVANPYHYRIDISFVRASAKKMLQKMKIKKEASIVFVDDAHIRKLNKHYLHHDRITDVLSFMVNDNKMIGEIFICAPQMIRQARRYKTSVKVELKRLLAHGILHLIGYDHIKVGERKMMRVKEKELLQM